MIIDAAFSMFRQLAIYFNAIVAVSVDKTWAFIPLPSPSDNTATVRRSSLMRFAMKISPQTRWFHLQWESEKTSKKSSFSIMLHCVHQKKNRKMIRSEERRVGKEGKSRW